MSIKTLILVWVRGRTD